MEEKQICTLLVGEAETEGRAKQMAEKYGNCPHINLIATKENQLFAIFFFQRDKDGGSNM